MSQISEAENDIRRLLAMTWRTWGNEPLDASSITRTWSLDLGWLAPTDAEILLTKLLAKGWLISKDDRLSTSMELDDVSVPLGWFPRSTVLENPPSCPQESNQTRPSRRAEKSISQESGVVEVAEMKTKIAGDKAPDVGTKSSASKSIVGTTGKQSFDVPALLQVISKESELARQEVMRRAQRKRKSLGHITVWMALILVARELQVDIEKLIPLDQ